MDDPTEIRITFELIKDKVVRRRMQERIDLYADDETELIGEFIAEALRHLTQRTAFVNIEDLLGIIIQQFADDEASEPDFFAQLGLAMRQWAEMHNRVWNAHREKRKREGKHFPYPEVPTLLDCITLNIDEAKLALGKEEGASL